MIPELINSTFSSENSKEDGDMIQMMMTVSKLGLIYDLCIHFP